VTKLLSTSLGSIKKLIIQKKTGRKMMKNQKITTRCLIPLCQYYCFFSYSMQHWLGVEIVDDIPGATKIAVFQESL
jgi:hypothetical protein